MELYLIRHGESIGNTKKGFISGRSDPDGLSKKGRTQMIRTAWELKDIQFDGIYTSPVQRARDSAEILQFFLKKNIEVQNWLTELNQGIFERQYWWDVIDKIPPKWRKQRNEYESAFPEGESMKDLIHRVADGFESFVKNMSPSSRIILISHNAVISALLYYLQYRHPNELDSPEKTNHYLSFMHGSRPPNASITKVTIEPDQKAQIKQIYEFPHLEVNEESVKFYAQALLRKPTYPATESISSSSGNQIYKLHYGQLTHIFKVFEAHELLPVRRLVKVYEYLETKKYIPAPKIISYDRSRVFFADAVLLQDYINGVELQECLQLHPSLRESLLNQLFELISHIHKLPCNEVRDIWYPDDWKSSSNPDWETYITQEILWTMEKIFEFGLDEDQMRNLVVQLRDLLHYVESKTYSIVPLHGDVSPHNFVVGHPEKCQIIRILDFERARLGDGLWDFAYFYGWMERVEPQSASVWRDLVLEKLNEEEKKHFILFRKLFHAWTVRDMLNYKGDTVRKRRADTSLSILKKEMAIDSV